jgi:hypothetical protein
MYADSKWVERNLGFDPILKCLPAKAFEFAPAAANAATIEDFQREIIDFESPAGPSIYGVYHRDRPVTVHQRQMA